MTVGRERPVLRMLPAFSVFVFWFVFAYQLIGSRFTGGRNR